MMPDLRLSLASLLRRIISRRFLKFGTVGVSGIVVNQGVFYIAQNYIFHVSHTMDSVDWVGLNLSLIPAIFCATINNFIWNRMWTWGDRKGHYDRPILVQFGQYTLSCGVSIALQVLFTNLLAPHVYSQIANLIAIAVTSVVNFLLNDIWTFGRVKLAGTRPSQKAGTEPGKESC